MITQTQSSVKHQAPRAIEAYKKTKIIKNKIKVCLRHVKSGIISIQKIIFQIY